MFKDGFADDSGAANESMPATTTVVTLTERDGGRTLMAIESQFPSLEAMEQLIDDGHGRGHAGSPLADRRDPRGQSRRVAGSGGPV